MSVEERQNLIPWPVPRYRTEASLVRLLMAHFERTWWKSADASELGTTEQDLAVAVYRSKRFLWRRAPDEIEIVLRTMDDEAFGILQRRFGQRSFDVAQFVQAVVHTGAYNAKRTLAFVGGVADLFLEVARSQAERSDANVASGAAGVGTVVNWKQLMNHIIESPELCMFKGVFQFGVPEAAEKRQDQQIQMNNFVDAAKHPGQGIQKLYWIPMLDVLTSVEGTDSVLFWSPHVPWNEPKLLTPDLGPEDYGPTRPPPFNVLSVAWDDEEQVMAALLSNRMLVQWRLRDRNKLQFQQKRTLKLHSFKGETKDRWQKAPWWVSLLIIGWKAPGSAGEKINYSEEPGLLRRELQDERQAMETSSMDEIWWNAATKCWITSDPNGKLYLWNLRILDGIYDEPDLKPVKVLIAHRKAVTDYAEISQAKFATCSLDRTLILWDVRSLQADVKLNDHTGCVLSLAYMPLFSSLISVGCEKRVLVWTVDATGFRGSRAKLGGHGANIQRAAAGQRVFFTLDESSAIILWDGATLVCLQSFRSNFMRPRHLLVLPYFGRICLAARRLTFYEGGDDLALSIGAPASQEQLAQAKKNKQSANFKDRATPRWCGLGESRGSILSATEAEVRVHSRGAPDQSRIIFNTPDGETVSVFEASDYLSLAVVGTTHGTINFLKYRSGFRMQEYPGRREDGKVETSTSPGGSGAHVAASPEATSPTSAVNSLAGAVSPHVPQSPSLQLPAVPEIGSSPMSAAGAAATPGAGKGRAGEPQQRNAPSAEDIARGLSSHILCAHICEAQRRVYIGTAEGQVLVFSCEPGFPAVWWLKHPVDPSAVTCLACDSSAEPFGLLTVGTQDGYAHVYGLESLRLAGSVNIPTALPDTELVGQSTAALSHAFLFQVSAEPELQSTLLTIDAQGRLRFWGMQIHSRSGTLTDLRLLLDAGRFPEESQTPACFVSTQADDRTPTPTGRSSRYGDDPFGAEESTSGSPAATAHDGGSFTLANSASGGMGASITAVAVIHGPLVPPTHAASKQPEEGPRPAAVVRAELDAEAAEAAARQAAEEAAAEAELARASRSRLPRSGGSPVPLGSSKPASALQAAGAASTELAEAERESTPFLTESRGSSVGDGLDSSEGESDEIVAVRNLLKVQSPRRPRRTSKGDVKAVGSQTESSVVNGAEFIFLADSAGCIWCVDVPATLAKAMECVTPVQVPPLDPASPSEKSLGQSIRFTTSILRGSLMNTVRRDIHAKPLQRPNPQAVQLVGGGPWQAHGAPVASLVAVRSPPALVSADALREVKIWSTTGDLWGHFSLGGAEGVHPAVALWPPPHSLAAQASLMRTAKGLCQRLGFQASHTPASPEGASMRDTGPSQGAVPSKGSTPASTPARSRVRTASDATLVGSKGIKRQPSLSSIGEASTPVAPGNLQVLLEGDGTSESGAARRQVADSVIVAAKAASLQGIDGEERKATPPDGGAAAEEDDKADGGPVMGADVRERSRKAFTPNQLSEMIRHGAFSSGCTSYREFAKKPVRLASSLVTSSRGGGEAAEVHTLRKDFLERPGSGLGITVVAEPWASTESQRGLGRRASSDSALLRHVQNTTNSMTQGVRELLDVDVTRLKRRDMRKASFVAALDIGGVSQDVSDPTSATAQAAKRVVARSKRKAKRGSSALDDSAPLAGAGRLAVGLKSR